MADYKKSSLHDYHIESGAKFAPYSAWSIVLNYANGQIFEQEYANEQAAIFDNSYISKFNMVVAESEVEIIDKLFFYSLKNQEVNTIASNMILDNNGDLVDTVSVYKMADNGYFIFSSVERCNFFEKYVTDYFVTQKLKESKFDNLTDYLGGVYLTGPYAIEALEKLEFTDSDKLQEGFCGAIEIAKCKAIAGVIKNSNNYFELQLICSEEVIEDLWIALYNTEPIFPIGFTAYNNLQLDKENGLSSYPVGRKINPVIYNLIAKEQYETFVQDNSKHLGIIQLPSRRLAFENAEVLNETADKLLGHIIKSYQSYRHNSAMAYVEFNENYQKDENLTIKNGNDLIKAKIIKIFNLN